MGRAVPEFLLLRHGETEWSRDGRHTGRTDIPLTDRGREQARALRPALEGRSFHRILCSPLGRARETCELAGLGGRAELRDELMEWDYGDYEGRTTEEIRAERPEWSLWRDGCPGGESPRDMAARADLLVAELLPAQGDVALFSHGHMLRVLAARWLEQELALGARLLLETGTLSAIGWDREWRVVRSWNAPAGRGSAVGQPARLAR